MNTHVILIDNYDSFTYNLVDALNQQGAVTTVFRNHIDVDIIKSYIQHIQGPKCLLISPGPDAPKDAGRCIDYVQAFQDSLPIFGVCLGHQVIGEAFGQVAYTVPAMHGETSAISHHAHPIFDNIPREFEVGRYHSLAIDCPDNFVMIANHQGLNMAMAHQEKILIGLQFHPESILTQYGHIIIKNLLTMTQEAYDHARF